MLRRGGEMKFPAPRCTKGSRRRGVALLVATMVVVLGVAIAASASAASSGAFGWGSNQRGQLGEGTTTSSDVPLAVTGLSGVTAVSGGADDSLALLSNGTVMAWGENGLGELGNGTTKEDSDVPVAVSGLSEVTAIAAGGSHGLALLRNGTVVAWGYNAFGQLGDGTTSGPETSCSDSLPCSRTPVSVSGLSEVTAIAAGYNYSLALLRNGMVMAWGYNESGALGKGTTAEGANPTPAPVSGLSEVTAIAAGLGGVSTALLKNGTVMDWGYGAEGQLGNGTTESSDVPVGVKGLSGVVALPNGGEGMALLSDGTVMDWGLNSVGELGNGTIGLGNSSDAPVAVRGLSGVTAIAGGFESRLALLSDGKAMAWGGGILGDGSETGSDVPVEVSGLSGATSIASGQYFGLAAAAASTALGSTGPTGLTGPAGATGPTGPNGVTGATGLAGATGAEGVTGAAGRNGTSGATALTGATGPTGAERDTGATGTTGTTGATAQVGQRARPARRVPPV
jgi:alpha-tubulin suppressor-like RCC1 family protein